MYLPLSHLRWIARTPLLLAAVLLAAIVARASAQAPPQYEIAVSPVTIEPAAPAAGQPVQLTVTIGARSLTPVARPDEAVDLRVLFLRVPQGRGEPAPEILVGEQVGTLRLAEPTRVSVPWTAEPGTHAFTARVEVRPGQRIERLGIVVSQEQPRGTTLAVPGSEPPGQPAGQPAGTSIVARPPGAAEPGRTIREPNDPRPSLSRRLATAPLGIVGAPDRDGAAIDGLTIDVPVYVMNAREVSVVEIRCSAFAISLGDLIGTGQATRAVTGGSLAEVVPVAIRPRPGRAGSRAVRYSCRAIFASDGATAEQRARMPGGAAGTADRRADYERQLGRPFAVFNDLAEGDVDPR